MVGDYKASLLNAIGNFGIKMPMTSLGHKQPLSIISSERLVSGVKRPLAA
jgi:hypothetical protein